MKRALMLFADGFEDVEAIATRDILVRGGVEVKDVRINEKEEVISSHKMTLTNFKSVDDIKEEDFDMIIVPGGSIGVKNLMNWSKGAELVKEFYDAGKFVAAICAGPMLLGKAGILKGKKYTCYAGCNEFIYDAEYTQKEVEVDNGIITARSMLYSIQFGLTLLWALQGEEVANKVYKQIEGLNRK